jgi:hypothetical protein
MPELDSTTLEKIADLREISEGWTQPLEVYELLKMNWTTVDPVYYAVTKTDEVSSVELPVAPVECRIIPKAQPAHFFEIEGDSSLSDEEISVEFWDGGFLNEDRTAIEGAGLFADLLEAEGEGVKAEVFLWFPAVELLLSVWEGHLRNTEESDAVVCSLKIAAGFRSPNLPLPRRAHYTDCQAVYGGLLDTLTEIAENDCPVDAHVPGGTVGNDSFPTCPRKSPTDCVARGISGDFHLSHKSNSVTVLNNQTKGPQLNSVSRGNESNLKAPVRVVMGVRRVRDMEVMAFRRDYNNNNPAQGFFNAMYEIGEGPIQSILSPSVNGQLAGGNNYAYRLGGRGQPPIDSTVNRLTDHAYSGTAYFRHNYGYVNPGTVGPDNMRGSAIIFGLNNIRRYTDADTYVSEWNHNRAWHIARIHCDKRWGVGYDYARLGIESWIDAGVWSDKYVTFTDPEGNSYSFYRAISDVELTERSAQQQIEDMCLAGRFSRPFYFQGKLHLMPLRGLTEEELADAPVFSDNFTPDARKIIWEEKDGAEQSTLVRSKKSDVDIPNRVEGTYHDSTKDWTEATAPPAEDVEQQLRAGRVEGDTSRRVVTKKYSFLGVVQEGHAVSLEWFILHFGEFCEGGILNNLRLKFKVWFLDALDLHQFKVVKVASDQLERYGFDYFRIIQMKRLGNLHCELTVQAHHNAALLAFDEEFETVPPEVPPNPPPTPPPPAPCVLEFGTVSWVNGLIEVPIEPC